VREEEDEKRKVKRERRIISTGALFSFLLGFDLHQFFPLAPFFQPATPIFSN
jgi:hypothetical protein